jgi:L-aspartate oxidase
LYRAVRARREIEFRAGLTAVALTRTRAGVAGVVAFDTDGRPVIIQARDTVLATGGIGQLFCNTTNPRSACGDGLAMALAAGARCASLELVQFHPTAIASTADPLPLVTEALRGAGAALVNDDGVRFMLSAHPEAELAPRDIVAREVWRQVQSRRGVYIDATRVFGADPAAFPSVRRSCAEQGIDPARQAIPVVPAAHYHMGGIAVDLDGRASIPHLWACGEVACSGVHGANRLASNSLLEAVVFGRRLGSALSAAAGARSECAVAIAAGPDPDTITPEIDPHAWRKLRHLMWSCMGIERDAAALREGLTTLEQLDRETSAQQILLHGRLHLARALMNAALARRESRGAHFRADDVRLSVAELNKCACS